MKITKGQLASLLILSRIFTLMTFVPLSSEGFTSLDIIAAIAFSTILQAVMAIPVFIVYDKTKGENIFSVIKEKNKALGIIVILLYAVFFLIMAVNALSGFRIFLNDVFGQEYGIWGMVFLLSVCFYGLFCGLTAIGRFSGIVFGLFVIMLASICIFSVKDFSILNFAPFVSGNVKTIWNAVLDDLARGTEIILFVLLISKTKGNSKCGFFSFLAGKTIILELVIAVITGVLGAYSRMTEYPFFKLGGYTAIHAIERLDAVYLVVWTLNALLTVSLFLTAVRELADMAFKSFKYENLCIILLTGITAVSCGAVPYLNSIMRSLSSAFSVAVMFFAIPFISLLFVRWKNESSK